MPLPTISSTLQQWIKGGLVLALACCLLASSPAWARGPDADIQSYTCDGDALIAMYDNGPVDAPCIPNSSGGTVPGAFVVLRWRDITLQLPRTNNAGAPSYTDGKWWWSLEDPGHPRFRLRRGDVVEFACTEQQV